MSLPGNDVLCDRLVRVPDVIGKDSVFGVLDGIMGEIMSCSEETQKRANVILVADAVKGANFGFLSLKVKTRNGQGIAKDSELILDYNGAGSMYDHTLPKDCTQPSSNRQKPIWNYMAQSTEKRMVKKHQML